MAKRRLNKVVKPKRQAPRNVVEWNRLLKRALARAETLKDRRVPGLMRALTTGKAERTLRQMGIISDEDILREFPNP